MFACKLFFGNHNHVYARFDRRKRRALRRITVFRKRRHKDIVRKHEAFKSELAAKCILYPNARKTRGRTGIGKGNVRVRHEYACAAARDKAGKRIANRFIKFFFGDIDFGQTRVRVGIRVAGKMFYHRGDTVILQRIERCRSVCDDARRIAETSISDKGFVRFGTRFDDGRDIDGKTEQPHLQCLQRIEAICIRNGKRFGDNAVCGKLSRNRF